MIASRISGAGDVVSIGPPLTTPTVRGCTAWLTPILSASIGAKPSAPAPRRSGHALSAWSARSAIRPSSPAIHVSRAACPACGRVNVSAEQRDTCAPPPSVSGRSRVTRTIASACLIDGRGRARDVAVVGDGAGLSCAISVVLAPSVESASNANARGATSPSSPRHRIRSSAARLTTTSQRVSDERPDNETWVARCHRYGRSTNAIADGARGAVRRSAGHFAGPIRGLHRSITWCRSPRAGVTSRRTCSSPISVATSESKRTSRGCFDILLNPTPVTTYHPPCRGSCPGGGGRERARPQDRATSDLQ